MNYLSKLKLKWNLVLMLLIPLLGLTYFAIDELRKSNSELTKTDNVKLLSELSVKSSALVHELQKERGLSAGYLGSNGIKFNTELIEQRKLTDSKSDILLTYLQEIDINFGPVFKQSMDSALKELSLLKSMRNSIFQQSVQLKSAIGFYTNLNALFIELIVELPKLSSIGIINNAATAYVNFILSKERAGIERAVLAATFASDQFAPGMYEIFRTLINEQNTYFHVFTSLATSPQVKAFNALLTQNAFHETEKMRNIAMAKHSGGNFNVDPKYWFDTQTEKINLLKLFEDQLSTDLLGLAKSVNNSTVKTLYIIIGISIISIFASLFIAWLVMKKILNQLGSDPTELHSLTEEIASGNLDVDINQNNRTSVGVLASMLTMRDKLRTQIESDRIMATENKRFKQALETVDTNIMITDQDCNIIYINPALNNFFSLSEQEFRKDIPSFTTNNLTDTSMDVFLKGTNQLHSFNDKLSNATKIDLTLGSVHVRLNSSPVFDENNMRQGTVIEWIDRYQEVVIHEEMSSIITDAQNGNLSRRISLENKESFFKDLSSGINQLMSVFDQVISDTANALAAMAGGDLTQKIDADYEGSFGQLRNDVNTTIDKLTEVASEISGSSGLVLNGSQEIAHGNTDLSQRTEQQASSLEETASSMEEMTSTVRQNADNARQANQLATATREQAEQGGNVVSHAVTAMTGITESSNKIAAIIGVIDEIAFQTNLLALNAAVEAARAGEQGRGFAVVASEVRNLAGRSATAAKEIKELIEDSVVKVGEGSKLVDASGQTLDEIMISVKKVSDIIAEIAAASQEQSEGIEQVNKAISQMDEMTQQNAALVEEAAAASESMGEQAGNLSKMVSFFKTGQSAPVLTRQERRHSDRPWSNHPVAPTISAKTANQSTQAHAVSIDADVTEWEEF